MRTATGAGLRTGLAGLIADPSIVDGDRLALITNYTGVTDDLVPNVTALQRAGLEVVALLGPEHGVSGAAQDGQGELVATAALPTVDTYGRSGPELVELLERCPTRHFVVDLQDVGSRYYTYIWTVHDVMAAADQLGAARVTVLDRPNPIGGAVAEGCPAERPWLESFVGRRPIPARHGLTVGELARHFRTSAGWDSVRLEVVPLRGWDRRRYADEWVGPRWVMPSPNLPTLDTAIVYPGTCLFEGTTLSEGRGTTRPFELVGAPFLDGRFAATCNDRQLPGVRFRDATFAPTFGKFAGQPCRGVQLHVTDRDRFAPVRTALSMMDIAFDLYPDRTDWRARIGDGAYPIDALWGSAQLREARAAGAPLADLATVPAPPTRWAGAQSMLYP